MPTISAFTLRIKSLVIRWTSSPLSFNAWQTWRIRLSFLEFSQLIGILISLWFVSIISNPLCSFKGTPSVSLPFSRSSFKIRITSRALNPLSVCSFLNESSSYKTTSVNTTLFSSKENKALGLDRRTFVSITNVFIISHPYKNWLLNF